MKWHLTVDIAADGDCKSMQLREKMTVSVDLSWVKPFWICKSLGVVLLAWKSLSGRLFFLVTCPIRNGMSASLNC
jgi:hypothetical protein